MRQSLSSTSKKHSEIRACEFYKEAALNLKDKAKGVRLLFSNPSDPFKYLTPDDFSYLLLQRDTLMYKVKDFDQTILSELEQKQTDGHFITDYKEIVPFNYLALKDEEEEYKEPSYLHEDEIQEPSLKMNEGDLSHGGVTPFSATIIWQDEFEEGEGGRQLPLIFETNNAMK